MRETETKRLRLRNWTLSDSRDMLEYANSELVGTKTCWAPHNNEEESKKEVVVHYYNITRNEYFGIGKNS